MTVSKNSTIVRNLLEVFNERDEVRRLRVIKELYTSQATFFEDNDSFTGHVAINQRVTEVLRTLPPEASFTPSGEPTANHNLARLPWILQLANGPVLASGMDVALLEGEKISALYLFINPAATAQA